MLKKESFILYASYKEVIGQLSDIAAGVLFKALLEYQATGEEIEMPLEVKIAFGFIKNQMRIDKEKYNKFCEKQADNGKKGGRPKKLNGFLENPNLFLETQKSLNDNVDVNENDKEDIPPCAPPKGKKAGNLLEQVLSSNPEFSIYKEVMQDWLDYKKSKGQAYKNERSLRACINTLLRLSGSSVLQAKLIVEQSMANSWQGLFALRDDGINKSSKSQINWGI